MRCCTSGEYLASESFATRLGVSQRSAALGVLSPQVRNVGRTDRLGFGTLNGPEGTNIIQQAPQ